MAKKHINNSLKKGVNCPYLFIMIMGFDIIILTMEFVEDVGYIIKKDQSSSFPISKKSIVEENGIQNIINIISPVKVIMQFNISCRNYMQTNEHLFLFIQKLVNVNKEKHDDKKKEKSINKIQTIDNPEKQYKATCKISPVHWLRNDETDIELIEEEGDDEKEKEEERNIVTSSEDQICAKSDSDQKEDGEEDDYLY